VSKNPQLLKDLESLLESTTRGDPESRLRWTIKSTRTLAAELQKIGYSISPKTVSILLKKLEYSLQANRKTIEGSKDPDRDAQFQHINEQVKAFQKSRQPVISVDTKKKELIGNFKNAGQTYVKKGSSIDVNVHDFPKQSDGKAAPYGVFDLTENMGYVNVGISSDTAAFAVASIKKWLYSADARNKYATATKLLITPDAGGSNGYKVRLWKYELQKLANETGIEISVCYFPVGTSKWNKIEHRLFSFITQNWQGRPLISLATIVNLIAATTTKTGLTVSCEIDHNMYQKGIKISNKEFKKINIVRNEFRGDLNYTIRPNQKLDH
jgi:hypothetical protein